ncbi:acyl-CoA N-acyltransferase [Cercophora newfieldiana]|uniref:Acyl-CoA N-acyltransferase n=1 Tax=Cercophora newfieldiana TaxID=92897 RepID=A0AA39Y8U9_9PEZI|nr:acyl-CoA N-acyltransferase [Cercophora newfieldiana]
MMASNLTFRTATAEDAPTLVDLINSSFRQDPTDEVFVSTDHTDFNMVDLGNLQSKISDPDCAVLIASNAHGSPIGHCYVRKLDINTAWMGLLAVDVQSQNGGVGRQMVAHAEDFARREWGSKRMTFNVVSTRSGLIAWYTRRGYRLTGETEPFPYQHIANWKGLFRGDMHYVFMGKDLGPGSGRMQPA